MTPKLSVNVHEQGSERELVELDGPLDVATAAEFVEALESVSPDPQRDVLLDLSHLDHLDSVGLGVLLRAVDELSRRHHLTMRRAPARVHRLFVLTGAVARLPFEDGGLAGRPALRGAQA